MKWRTTKKLLCRNNEPATIDNCEESIKTPEVTIPDIGGGGGCTTGGGGGDTTGGGGDTTGGGGGLQGFGRLIVKPGHALIEIGKTITLQVYYVNNGTEQQVTSGVVFATNNTNIISLNSQNGNAFGIRTGIASVTATWNSMVAGAQIEVIEECAEKRVHVVLLIDNSNSMALQYDNRSKLQFAREVAIRIANEINYAKDKLYLGFFNENLEWMNSYTYNSHDAEWAIQTITIKNVYRTNVINSITSAAEMVKARKAINEIGLIITISDGWDSYYINGNNYRIFAARLMPMYDNDNIILMNIGVKAFGEGYDLLHLFSTGGFFINATGNNSSEIMGYASGLKGYICAGNCYENLGYTINAGKLNYDKFKDWNVVSDAPDLFGNGFYDILPGNGLYVSLASMEGYDSVLYYDTTWIKTSPGLLTGFGINNTIDEARNIVIKYDNNQKRVVDGVRIRTRLYYDIYDRPISYYNAGRIKSFSVYGRENQGGPWRLIKIFDLDCNDSGELEYLIGLKSNYIFRLGNTKPHCAYAIIFNETCEGLPKVFVEVVDTYMLAGPIRPYHPEIILKTPITIPANTQWRIKVTLAGNQRFENNNGENVTVKIIDKDNVAFDVWQINVPWDSGFNEYVYQPQAPSENLECRIAIGQYFPTAPGAGALVKSVRVELLPSNTVLFDGDFNQENPVYISSICDQANPHGYFDAVRCGGVGCLGNPPSQQNAVQPQELPE